MSAEQAPVSIVVADLPVAVNICQQELREVWQDTRGLASLAHVIMEVGAESLLHQHHTMAELYYILKGLCVLTVGESEHQVGEGMAMDIPPLTPHKLKNIGEVPLEHLVIATPQFDPNDVEVLK